MVDAILLRMNQRYEEKKEQVEDAIPSDLKTDLPTAWTTEIDDFIGVYALNLPFIDSTSKVAPESR